MVGGGRSTNCEERMTGQIEQIPVQNNYSTGYCLQMRPPIRGEERDRLPSTEDLQQGYDLSQEQLRSCFQLLFKDQALL